ncbi:MAG: KH domain-containing protein [Thermoprotei archaeon]
MQYRIFLAELGDSSKLLGVYQGLKDFLHIHGVELLVDKEKGVLIAQGPPDRTAKVSDMVQLLIYGVSPARAQKYFLNDEYYFRIDLNDTLNPKDVTRTLARIIGSKGSFKRKLEELTKADIIVHDSNVVIVGDYAAIELARMTIEEVILGKPQSVVIRNLQRRMGG